MKATVAALAFLALAAPALAAPPPAAQAAAPPIATLADDLSLGSPRAPVTVIEYASLGCSHCADWSRANFAAFRKRFIDTGRVRFVLREMLNGDPDIAAAGFLTARCAGPAHYFQIVEGLFAAQPQMVADGNDLPSLLRVAGTAGLSRAQVADCLSDHAALAALQKRVDTHESVDKVEATPTFDINGKRLAGEETLAALATAINQAAAHPSRRR